MPKQAGRGRPFAKGNPGKPPGAVDTKPRKQRASVVAIISKYVEEHPEQVQAAIQRGMEGTNPARYLELAAAHLDGNPIQKLQLGGDVGGEPIRVTFGGRYRPDADEA